MRTGFSPFRATLLCNLLSHSLFIFEITLDARPLLCQNAVTGRRGCCARKPTRPPRNICRCQKVVMAANTALGKAWKHCRAGQSITEGHHDLCGVDGSQAKRLHMQGGVVVWCPWVVLACQSGTASRMRLPLLPLDRASLEECTGAAFHAKRLPG